MDREIFTLTLFVGILLFAYPAVAQVSHPADAITGGEFSDDYNFTGVAYHGAGAASIFGDSNGLRFSDPSGATVMTINNGGVGIGTSPSFPLDVNGNANIGGTLDVGGSINLGGNSILDSSGTSRITFEPSNNNVVITVG